MSGKCPMNNLSGANAGGAGVMPAPPLCFSYPFTVYSFTVNPCSEPYLTVAFCQAFSPSASFVSET